MPELVIKTAIDNGDLPKDYGRSFKAVTLFDALKNTTVVKNYNQQFRKEFGRGYQGYPSLFIVTEQDMQEIPYHSVMLDTKSGRFDDKRMAQYVKRYLLERKIA